MLKYLYDPWNFDLGVKLFNHFFPNDNLKISLNKGYTISGQEKMNKLLKTVSSKGPIEDVFEEEMVPVIEKVDLVHHTKVNNSEATTILKELKQKKARLFSQAAASHLELSRHKLSEKERYILAKLIIENFEEIDSIWLTLDYYDKHKVLPNKYKYENDYKKGVEDRKRMLNLRTYITKLEKAIPLLKSGKKIAQKEEKLNEYKFELENLMNGN